VTDLRRGRTILRYEPREIPAGSDLRVAGVVVRPGRSDHDHCAFCWVYFEDHVFSDDAETHLERWANADGDQWVCRTCFADFRDAFQFQTADPAP
jgi:hypothetical protein